MNCAKIREMLSSYIDDMLPAKDMLLVKKHLETCQNCRQYLSELKDTVRILQESADVPLPAQFSVALHQNLVAEQNAAKIVSFPSKNKKFTYRKVAILAASLVILISISTYGAISLLDKNASNNEVKLANTLQKESQEEDVGSTPVERSKSEPLQVSPQLAQEFDSTLNSVHYVAKENTRNASLKIMVDDVNQTMESLSQIAKKYGGYVATSQPQYDSQNNIVGATMELWVATAQVEQALAVINNLGTINESTIKDNAKIQEYNESNNLLAQKEKDKASYEEVLSETTNPNDIAWLENQIKDLEAEITDIQSQLSILEQATCLSYIFIKLEINLSASNNLLVLLAA